MNRNQNMWRLSAYILSGVLVAGSASRVWYNYVGFEAEAPPSVDIPSAPNQTQDASLADDTSNESDDDSQSQTFDSSSDVTEVNAPTLDAAATTPQSFDVPALIGLNVDQVIDRLGKPIKTLQSSRRAKERNLLFRHDSQQLLVHYKRRTGRILDFYLPAANPDGYLNVSRLLTSGNITDGNPSYSLDWAYMPGSNRIFKGVKITPTQAE